MASRPETHPPETDELCTKIVEAVAERKQCDATELPPLYETIDPAAITGLFGSTPTHSRPTGRLTFEYCEYRVAVDAGGSVSITSYG
ncbi:HalOD1 output domain-containing protein [Natrialba sp. PRR66]|uniref:HalOD1 output domain-containing protein n=1 Tax=Natrialba sp. PRR66 TaxID=3098146 RepID=UPI002B1DC0E2|nr:HalOD1 output domain-containing protein [Natrialba sp. PRR66]